MGSELEMPPKDYCYSGCPPIWENLPTSHILYNPSSEMRVGIEERIEARISNSSIENLKKGLKGRGYPQSEEINVSSRMIVRLEGGMISKL
jgi:hypothetical protein